MNMYEGKKQTNKQGHEHTQHADELQPRVPGTVEVDTVFTMTGHKPRKMHIKE
jgi:hypothetical protein